MHRRVTKYITPYSELSPTNQIIRNSISESAEYYTAQHRSDYPERYCDSSGAYTGWEDVREEEGLLTVGRVADSTSLYKVGSGYSFYSFRTNKVYKAVFEYEQLVPDFTKYKLLANTYGDRYFVTITLIERYNLDNTGKRKDSILRISEIVQNYVTTQTAK